MIYFKGVLIGLGSVLLGCLAAPVALMFWARWRSPGVGTTVSFSQMGLANHLAYSQGFWILVLVLFAAGFVPSVLLPKR